MHTLALYSLFLSGALLIMWLACRIIGTPRRSMILSVMLFALVAAAVPFFMTKEVGAISIEPGTIEVIETTAIQPIEQPGNLLLEIYIIGLIVSGLYLLFTLGRIAWIIMRSKPNGGIRLHDRTDLVPFTWGRWIIMSRKDYNDHKEMLLAHETAHLRSAHWLDILALGVVECITWYCPAARLLRRQLIAAHEYTADAAVLAAGVAPADYQMLLIEKASGRRFANSVTACINHNSLKNRILMMQNPSLWQRARLRALALVPAGILVLAIATSPVLAQKPVINIETPAAVVNPERKVVDDAEVRPEFPGGELAMMDFLRKTCAILKRRISPTLKAAWWSAS